MLGSDGNKMSKSLRNYPSVYEVFDRDGADAMRWFLMSSPILRGGNLIVTEQGIRDSVRQVLIPLWNSWYFFALYANAAGYDAQRSTGSEDPLDGYLLAKLRQYVEAMTEQLDNYEVANACDSTRAFLDVLTNWYIRRSRERFWATDGAVDVGAFDTLHTVLETVTRVAAPLLPLTTEEIWRGLTGERSVHLTDWPDPEALPRDDALVTAMDLVRDVCSTGSSLRKAAGLRNRLPLSTLTVVVDDAAALDRFASLVADELNIKSVRLLDAAAPEAASYGVAQRLTVNARAAGPRLGRDVQTAIKGSKSGRLVGRRGRHGHRRGPGAGRGGVHPRDRGRIRRRRHHDRDAPARRVRRPGHVDHPGAGGRGAGPRPGPRRPAGPPRGRPRRLRPDLAVDHRLGRRARRGPDPRGS